MGTEMSYPLIAVAELKQRSLQYDELATPMLQQDVFRCIPSDAAKIRILQRIARIPTNNA